MIAITVLRVRSTVCSIAFFGSTALLLVKYSRRLALSNMMRGGRDRQLGHPRPRSDLPFAMECKNCFSTGAARGEMLCWHLLMTKTANISGSEPDLDFQPAHLHRSPAAKLRNRQRKHRTRYLLSTASHSAKRAQKNTQPVRLIYIVTQCP